VGRELGPEALLLVNLSGRGDKDVQTAAAWFGLLDGPDEVDDGDGPEGVDLAQGVQA